MVQYTYTKKQHSRIRINRSKSKSKELHSLHSLFDNQQKGEKKKYNVKLGYGSEDIAYQTIKNVKKFEKLLAWQMKNLLGKKTKQTRKTKKH